MGKTESSRRWIHRQHTDRYVKQAHELGYRSRALFKLQEIDRRYGLFRSGKVVVDLGAAPGGWSQYAVNRIGKNGKIIAIDILMMEPLPGVEILQGDFRQESVLGKLLEILGNSPVDIIMSDMAPNISGVSTIDQPRALYLAELALELARDILKPGGDLLVKLFQGQGYDVFVSQARNCFTTVRLIKPKASRQRSREIYLLGRARK
jgi:23S rRNA (uridine2552-2'-O)-methyltransferase